MEYSALQTFITVLLAICAGVVCIGGAAAAVVKFWKWAHKDTDSNTDRLDEHDNYLAADKRRIETLERNQDEAEKQNKLLLKAVVALMGHELDGNHTTQLEDVREEIQTYLIER